MLILRLFLGLQALTTEERRGFKKWFNLLEVYIVYIRKLTEARVC